jgi:ABC-type bacteriocin/lantibiotic exporter with double-glycine peptidase domain
MIECALVGWLTLIVLIITGAIVCWYSIETRKLRQQAERQTKESQLRQNYKIVRSYP